MIQRPACGRGDKDPGVCAVTVTLTISRSDSETAEGMGSEIRRHLAPRFTQELAVHQELAGVLTSVQPRQGVVARDQAGARSLSSSIAGGGPSPNGSLNRKTAPPRGRFSAQILPP